MIYVDRSRIAPPDILALIAPKEVEKAKTFFKSPEKSRRQRRFDFQVYRRPEVRAALGELFYNKCAYCESRSHVGLLDIELFRPKATVMERPDHPGYWWLASSWENFLVAC